jgi:hypothetical protein
MAHQFNLALIIAAILDVLAAALHVGAVIGGPSWYRFLGAGEGFARAVEAGKRYPTLITLGIALVLLAWAALALSGAGVIGPLPLLRPALVGISLVYLVRGFGGPFLLAGTGRSRAFILVSSAICLGFAFFHLLGLAQHWEHLG